MICEECKNCSNYMVSEVGCYGNEEPCEYLMLDNEEIDLFLK